MFVDSCHFLLLVFSNTYSKVGESKQEFFSTWNSDKNGDRETLDIY